MPDDEDDAFVLNYDLCDENESMYFRFVVSTKRLISHCRQLENICADATYKLVWQGFPYLVMGTVDRAKKFHPLCFSCSSHEQQDDFEFLFQTMKSFVEKSYVETEFHPKLLISDASYAITNAFDAIFPGGKKIMCFSHVKRNVLKRPLNDKKNRQPIVNDIDEMHLAQSEEQFQMMATLFLNKWRKIEHEFINYFEEQWLNAHCNWHESAAIYTPSTNNNLEGKFQHTHQYSN